MKPSLIFILLVLSIFLNETQGIRLNKLSISASNHQELVPKNSSTNQFDGSKMATEISSGINRKLMTKTIPSSSTTNNNKNYKNDPKANLKFTHHEQVGTEEIFPTTLAPGSSKHGNGKVASERYPDVIDITGMDYSPARRKPPIHN